MKRNRPVSPYYYNVLRELLKLIENKQPFPTYNEIAHHAGCSRVTAYSYVRTLRNSGSLRFYRTSMFIKELRLSADDARSLLG